MSLIIMNFDPKIVYNEVVHMPPFSRFWKLATYIEAGAWFLKANYVLYAIAISVVLSSPDLWKKR